MGTNAENAYEGLKGTVGNDEGVGEWFEVDQDRINAFADATLDHQFIHVDPERAKAGPFGGPIAHGFLTLSLLPHLTASVRPATPTNVQMTGIMAGVNYGFEKVRFLNPVRVNAKVRAKTVTSDVQLKGTNNVLTTKTVTIEIEGETKPAVVAEWLTMLAFA